MRPTFADRLVACWYSPRLTLLSALLLPLSAVFGAAIVLRRALYRVGLLRSITVSVPVVVVGNLTVGGSGKTPLVIALARALEQRGWVPGVVSRGYGGTSRMAQSVAADSDPAIAGDEPVMIARAGIRIWIGRDRAAAARALLAQDPSCNVIIADDGLQHYALGRAVEIVAVGNRGFGNGLLLPAGPLREPRSRVREVDALVVSGSFRSGDAHPPVFRQTLSGDRFVRVKPAAAASGQGLDSNGSDSAGPERFRTVTVYAIAGIAEPDRFFERLRELGIVAICRAFPDHHAYTPGDLDFADASAILMTEKDAVKCLAFADDRCWMLPVRAVIDPHLVTLVEEKLRGCKAS